MRVMVKPLERSVWKYLKIYREEYALVLDVPQCEDGYMHSKVGRYAHVPSRPQHLFFRHITALSTITAQGLAFFVSAYFPPCRPENLRRTSDVGVPAFIRINLKLLCFTKHVRSTPGTHVSGNYPRAHLPCLLHSMLVDMNLETDRTTPIGSSSQRRGCLCLHLFRDVGLLLELLVQCVVVAEIRGTWQK